MIVMCGQTKQGEDISCKALCKDIWLWLYDTVKGLYFKKYTEFKREDDTLILSNFVITLLPVGRLLFFFISSVTRINVYIECIYILNLYISVYHINIIHYFSWGF